MSMLIDLEDWLRTPAGACLLEWEGAAIDGVVADIFGYQAVQIGLPGIDLLAASRIAHRFHCARGVGSAAQVNAHAFALPFASASLDLVLLPHVLEFSPHPHRVLREVERVLVPEGSVVLSGFNPLSLWGMWQLLARRRGVPWSGAYRSLTRLREWLSLLGFEVQAQHFGVYVPPFGRAAWLQRWQWMDRAGARYWRPLGAGYVVHGIKRVQGMRLITPNWRDRKAAAGKLSPVAQRNGDTRKVP